MGDRVSKLHGRIVDGVPTWVAWCAYATTLTVLPSGVWRIALVVGGADLMTHEPSLEGRGPVLWDGPAYVITLTVVSELLALLTIGLVAPWGERVPRWVPGLGGRRIPVLAAVVPAAIGATICTILWPYTCFMLSMDRNVNGTHSVMGFTDLQAWLFWGAYLPLVLWGPLVWICTVHYWRRRTATGPVTAPVEVGVR